MRYSLDIIPIRSENVISRSIDNEAVLVIPDLGEVKVINETGALIWDNCDGRMSVDQLIEMVCSEYLVDREAAESDVMEFLDSLHKRGLINLLGQDSG